MEVHKLPIFESWCDGNMNLASRIVNVFRNSNNFKSKNYPGQDDFYDEYMTKYSEYVKMISDFQLEKNQRLNDQEWDVIHKIEEGLRYFREKRILTFGHFLAAYIQILLYGDMINELDIHPYWLLDKMKYTPISPDMSLTETIKVMDNYAKKFYDVVPFTSLSGLFGMNTYLYLFFNNINPVAYNPKGYPLDDDHVLQGGLHLMVHDFGHSRIITRLYPKTYVNSITENYPRKHTHPEHQYSINQNFFNKMKDVYNKMFTLDLPDYQLKAFIILLFALIHEFGVYPNCNRDRVSILFIFNQDDIMEHYPLLSKNKYYTPERYGYNSEKIEDFYRRRYDLVEYDQIRYIKDYIEHAMIEIYQNFCTIFKEYGFYFDDIHNFE